MVLQHGSALTSPSMLLKEKVQLNPYFHLRGFLDKYAYTPTQKCLNLQKLVKCLYTYWHHLNFSVPTKKSQKSGLIT